MTVSRFAQLAALAMAAACTHSDAISRADTSINDNPPKETDTLGTCWAREVTPAVYEQVMGEVQVVQAEIAADGSMIRPPIYRRAPVPRIVRPRTEMRFEAPCEAQMTPDFIASVQRALTARGYYNGPITGTRDTATQDAIRRYQTERGLDSGQVSLETARALGLVAVDISGG